jgi:thiopurine S-methyltransferase
MTLSPKDRDDWVARWREGRIQFHVDKVNPVLGRYVDRLLPEEFGCVLVPLCGKSLDLGWLVGRGYEVVGVELVEKAVEDLFSEIGGNPNISSQGKFQSWQGNGLQVLVADLFELDANVIGKFDAIWDRAALVALRPSDRDHYARNLQEFLRPNGRILLSTISFDPSKMEGPPFSVSANEVRRHFGNSLTVEKLEENINIDPNQCFTENGIDRVLEEVWLIS